MLDIVLNHIRDSEEHIAKGAEKAGIEYHSLEFIQLMDHLCDRGVIQKAGSSYLITLLGRQFNGFALEAEELRKEKERDEEKRKRDEERDKYDLLSKKFFYKWRWTPWFVSFIALIFSILTYFKKSESQQPKKETFSTSTAIKDTSHQKQNPTPKVDNKKKQCP